MPPVFKTPPTALITMKQNEFKAYQLPETADPDFEPVTITIISTLDSNCLSYIGRNQTFIMAPSELCSPDTYPTTIKIEDTNANANTYTLNLVVEIGVPPATPANPTPLSPPTPPLPVPSSSVN